MDKTILLIPGLNGRFDSFTFEVCKTFAKERGIQVKEMLFSKYSNEDKFESTFNEQKKEIENLIKEINGNVIIVAKSLGCITAILIEETPSILISPTISIGKEENVFDLKFSYLETKPVKINNKRLLNNKSIIYGDVDEKIDVNTIGKLKNIRLIKIKDQGHSLEGEDVNKALRRELEYYA